jgi:TetR/AcrR family transcriptional regulator, transcriptional repressor for nem operon
MPWPKDHKAKTRERIVSAAAAAFRGRGVSDVRIEEIMAGAGLTHGGFYSHFASKEELLGEALQYASGKTIDYLSDALRDVAPERRLGAVIGAYLSSGHVADPAHGCPVAALGPEVARADEPARRQLARGVRRRIEWMSAVLPARRGRSDRTSDVIGVFACMIGGVILARLAGRRGSAAILEACREFLQRALEER